MKVCSAYAAGMRCIPLGTGTRYAEGYAASHTLRSRGGWCIPSAPDVPRRPLHSPAAEGAE
jgi:hypothetical protein